MNTPKENSHTDQTKNRKYAFVQREGDDFTCIKLLQGKYKGIIYKYGKVGFAKEEKPDGTLPMKFDYEIICHQIHAVLCERTAMHFHHLQQLAHDSNCKSVRKKYGKTALNLLQTSFHE